MLTQTHPYDYNKNTQIIYDDILFYLYSYQKGWMMSFHWTTQKNSIQILGIFREKRLTCIFITKNLSFFLFTPSKAWAHVQDLRILSRANRAANNITLTLLKKWTIHVHTYLRIKFANSTNFWDCKGTQGLCIIKKGRTVKD